MLIRMMSVAVCLTASAASANPVVEMWNGHSALITGVIDDEAQVDEMAHLLCRSVGAEPRRQYQRLGERLRLDFFFICLPE